jgi:aspartyl protease family protein
MSNDENKSAVEQPFDSRPMGRVMLYLCWIIALVLASWVAGKWLDRQNNPNTNPLTQIDGGVREVVLLRNRYGHYVASGSINGEAVVMLLDTGASDIAVPEKMADRLGLKRLAPIEVSTANGVAEAWITRIAEVRIGNIVLTDVRASINPGMNHDDSVLLGMSALKNVEFEQKGNRLVLRR